MGVVMAIRTDKPINFTVKYLNIISNFINEIKSMPQVIDDKPDTVIFYYFINIIL
jgi:hypothetical protein